MMFADLDLFVRRAEGDARYYGACGGIWIRADMNSAGSESELERAFRQAVGDAMAIGEIVARVSWTSHDGGWGGRLEGRGTYLVLL
jgi:hypothetical protein